MVNSKSTRTKPIEGDPDGHNDLRVVWDSTGTRILSDRRIKIMDSQHKNEVTATRS